MHFLKNKVLINSINNYFKEAEEQKAFSFEFQKLGIISNEKSRGYQDFLKHLKTPTIARENIILEDIKMTHENIIASIKKLNDENECQGKYQRA